MTTEEQIECAIARVESVDWICRNLHVTPGRVFAVMSRTDLLAKEIDTEIKRRPGRPRRDVA